MSVRILLRVLLGVASLFVVAVLVALAVILIPSIPTYTGPDPAVTGVRKRIVKVNGVKLHIAEAGKAERPLILFLHGFPEFWYEWREYLPHFAAKGFYAVAPDQRGYNLSDKPTAISDYRIDVLVDDIAALIRALGKKKAHIVGHDWGAMVAWGIAISKPELVQKVVTINVPHPLVFADAIANNPKQRRRSRYIKFFQLPLLPEKLLARNNWAQASKALIQSSLPGTYPEKILQHYRHAWSRPGAITSMLTWYRAVPKKMTAKQKKLYSNKVKPPLLLIWGAKDHALGVEMAKPSVALCKQGRLEQINDATHWVVHEKVKHLQTVIFRFFKQHTPSPKGTSSK